MPIFVLIYSWKITESFFPLSCSSMPCYSSLSPEHDTLPLWSMPVTHALATQHNTLPLWSMPVTHAFATQHTTLSLLCSSMSVCLVFLNRWLHSTLLFTTLLPLLCYSIPVTLRWLHSTLLILPVFFHAYYSSLASQHTTLPLLCPPCLLLFVGCAACPALRLCILERRPPQLRHE